MLPPGSPEPAAHDRGHPVGVSALRRERLEHGFTLRGFAQAVHVSVPTVSRWETGVRRPHTADMCRIAQILSCPVPLVVSWFRELPVHGAEYVPTAGLRRLREDRQLSRAKLAAEVGVATATIAHWECGRRALPAHRLHRLAFAFGLPANVLLRELIDDRPVPMTPLRRLRKQHGLSLEDVARRLGVTGSIVARWENSSPAPGWAYVRELAVLYGVPISRMADMVGLEAPRLLDTRLWRPDEIGPILRDLRTWRGETLMQVADRVGVHWETLRRWETGISRPRRRHREPLQRALGVSVRLPIP